MAKVTITGLKTRQQAKDYGAVDGQHKPGTKGGPLTAIMTPPLRRGDAKIVPATQPDTRVK
jgi:hypothetical protein